MPEAAVGDEAGARIQDRVGREEIAHVAFALEWFERFTGRTDFDTWLAHLPPPISPILLKGRPLHREFRARAGQSDTFLDALDAYEGTP